MQSWQIKVLALLDWDAKGKSSKNTLPKWWIDADESHGRIRFFLQKSPIQQIQKGYRHHPY